MNDYNKKIDDIYKEYNSNYDGLSSVEAAKRLERYGENKLVEKKKKSFLKRFLDQFNDPMIIVLIIVAIAMFIYGILYSHEYTDSIIITVVVFMNSIMSFIQENKAEVTLDSLKKYSNSNVKVKRDGKISVLDSKEIVLGDIIILQAGDKVPCDARIIEENDLYVDESALTGESVPVRKSNRTLNKQVEIQDQVNMVFCGTNITGGETHCIVVKTGMYTEIGKIAKSLNTPYKVETPLEKKIKEISKVISIIIFLIIIGIFTYSFLMGYKFLEIIMLCVTLAVAGVPEGLPAVITITLSNGTGILSRKKAVVRQMSAVETLGSINVICSDKTGTITQNKMNVINTYIYNEEMLENIFALCNDTVIDNGKLVGDPTESCLYDYLIKQKKDPLKIRHKYHELIAAPFDSERKMMSTINDINKTNYILTKGSFENVLSRCKFIYKNGKVVKITKKDIENLKENSKEMANNALRVMAYAYKKLTKIPNTINRVLAEEKHLVLAGIIGIMDPPRKGIKRSVDICKKSGIKPIMITGDSLETATAIAKQVGIVTSNNEGLLGSELDNYSDEELLNIIPNYSVYARVSPTHKERIVHTFQKLGNVVAMTGDGVNDAPAIKDAHVGIGMGITGTEVTKSVADVILLDDSFSTIVTAIKEGRRIFNNIRNNIVYSLSSNFAEIFTVLVGMFTGNMILLPIHILFIDLITDSIPSIALSFEPNEKDVMNKPPRSISKPLFTPFIISCFISSAIIETIGVLLTYYIASRYYSPQVASTLALLSVVIQEIVYAISCRNLKSPIYKQGIFSNKHMNIGLIIIILIEMIFFLTPAGKIINIVDVDNMIILKVALLNSLAFVIYELIKPILKKLFND